MKRMATITAIALMATTAMAQGQLAEVGPGESASGEWVVDAPFETAELAWTTRVVIDGPGTLTLCYPGNGSMALTSVEGPTEGRQELSLHLRANPGRVKLPVRWSFEAGDAAATCEIDEPQVERLYQHVVPRVADAPVIDGDLSDACWSDEARVGDRHWRMYNEPRDARMATDVWCCYDDDNLYAAFRCETPDVDELVSDVTRHDGYAWRDDSAEIFFDIGHDHDTYYEYIVTPDEVVFDSKWFYEGGQWLTTWDYIGEWKTAIEPGAWIVEIRLALESYEERDLQGNPTGYMPLPTGDVAGILFSRNDRVVGEGMSHADCVGSFHEVHQYGHLVRFRPNRTEAYRKTALREIERLEGRWGGTYYAAGAPELDAMPTAVSGLPDALAALRERIEAPAPQFDEWVAITTQLRVVEDRVQVTESALAPLVAGERWPEAAWGLAVERFPHETPALMVCEDAVELSAARGEAEGRALVVLPRGGEVTDVRVTPGPLEGPRDQIPATAVRWYAMGENGRLQPMTAVTGDEALGIWWEVTVPEDVAAGVYRGEIVTTDGEGEVALPVELTVHDFALPAEPSLALSAAFDAEGVTAAWYEERGPLGSGEYLPFAEMLLEHRVMPREMLADLTRWGDGQSLSLSRADSVLEGVEEAGLLPRALVAARPENLAGLESPRRALARAVHHWADRLGEPPLAVYAPAGAAVPEGLRTVDYARSVAVGRPDASDLPGTWALSPEVATGLGDCDGARLKALAGELEKGTAWRIAQEPETLMDVRMLGWLAEARGQGRVFWDVPGAEGTTASGLVAHMAGQRRLQDPQPTIGLKVLRDAVEDYDYVRVLEQLNGRLGPHQVGDTLWRLRLANQTVAGRNRDMVMNARVYNRDPEHLMRRRARIARQIERSRRSLRVFGEEGPLPGDVTR